MYEKSSLLGNTVHTAMSNVGNCYEDGDGVAEDVNKAKKWYTKEAAQGSESAQTQLDKLNAR